MTIRCPACLRVNKAPDDKIAQGHTPYCGGCHAALPVPKPSRVVRLRRAIARVAAVVRDRVLPHA